MTQEPAIVTDIKQKLCGFCEAPDEVTQAQKDSLIQEMMLLSDIWSSME